MGCVASEDLEIVFWKGKGRVSLRWERQLLRVVLNSLGFNMDGKPLTVTAEG